MRHAAAPARRERLPRGTSPGRGQLTRKQGGGLAAGGRSVGVNDAPWHEEGRMNSG